VKKNNLSLEKKTRFSLPDFLSSIKNFFLATQNTIGIDVGTGYVKIVQLQKSRGGYLITDYKVRAIPFKMKDDPKQKDRFVKEFIKEFISQSRIKTSLGRLTIGDSGVFIFSFSLPPLSDKDLRGAVGIELKKRLPFQIDFKNIFYNYFITDRFGGETPSFMVTCIAIDNNTLEGYLNFLKEFKLRPVVIATAADTLGNLVGSLEEAEYVAVLDMGAKESYLNFYKRRLLQFTRQIPIGGEQFTQGILKALSFLKEDVAFEDAEAFKRQCGIPLEREATSEFYTDFGAISGSRITTVLRPILERLIMEISRTFAFYFRTYKVNSVDVLYFTGGGSRIKNIDKILSANLSNLSIKTIKRLNPLKGLKGWLDAGVFRHEMVMEEAAPHLSCAFGVCIDKGSEVNLIPPKEKIEQRALFLMFLVRLTFPLVLIIVLGLYAFSYGRALLYHTLAAKTEIQLTKLAPLVDEINASLSMMRSLSERESLLSKAIGRQPLWWGILKELSNITPQEVTLTRLEIRRSETGKQLVLVGEVTTEYTNLDLIIAQFNLNLEESPYFTDVDLISSKRDLYSPIPKSIFEIVCNLVY
jgi:type IV pilus assembly protein PilM